MFSNMIVPTKTVPVNFCPLKGADGHAKITGPCGDTMEFWLSVKEDQISYATYTTDGCYHSIMCGCLTALLAVGKPLDFIRQFKPEYVLALVEDIPEEYQHCALLASNTLKAALEDYLSKQVNE